MNDSLVKLLDYLSKEESIYRLLLDLSDQKRQAIVKGEIALLDEIVSKEESLIEEISSIEEARMDLTKEIAIKFKIRPEEITLDTWPENLSEKDHEGLKNKQNVLSELLQELDRQNQINAKLIEVHLNYIDYLFDTATQTKETTAYSADGSLDSKKSQSANLFDEMM